MFGGPGTLGRYIQDFLSNNYKLGLLKRSINDGGVWPRIQTTCWHLYNDEMKCPPIP